MSSGKLYKIEDGVYSDSKQVPEIAVVTTKYPNAVITGESTYYYLHPKSKMIKKALDVGIL